MLTAEKQARNASRLYVGLILFMAFSGVCLVISGYNKAASKYQKYSAAKLIEQQKQEELASLQRVSEIARGLLMAEQAKAELLQGLKNSHSESLQSEMPQSETSEVPEYH